MQVLPCQGRVLELTTQVIGLTNLDEHKWALLNHYVAAHGRLPGAQATGATGGSAAGPAAQGVKRVRFKSKGGRSTEDVVGWVGGKNFSPQAQSRQRGRATSPVRRIAATRTREGA